MKASAGPIPAAFSSCCVLFLSTLLTAVVMATWMSWLMDLRPGPDEQWPMGDVTCVGNILSAYLAKELCIESPKAVADMAAA